MSHPFALRYSCVHFHVMRSLLVVCEAVVVAVGASWSKVLVVKMTEKSRNVKGIFTFNCNVNENDSFDRSRPTSFHFFPIRAAKGKTWVVKELVACTEATSFSQSNRGTRPDRTLLQFFRHGWPIAALVIAFSPLTAGHAAGTTSRRCC